MTPASAPPAAPAPPAVPPEALIPREGWVLVKDPESEFGLLWVTIH